MIDFLEVEDTMPTTLLPLPPHLSSFKEAINKRLNTLIQPLALPPFQSLLIELLEKGGRFRSMLLLATMEGLGSSWSAGLEVACAVELLYLSTDILTDRCSLAAGAFHDPSEDPVESLFLLSQAMTQRAYEIISSQEHLPSSCRVNLIHVMSRLSGVHHLILGKTKEIELQQHDLSPEQIWEVHRLHTGSLLRCAMECAAYLSQASQVSCKRLGLIGEELGIAHQLIDDVLEADPPYSRPRTKHHGISAIRVLGVALARSQALQLLQHASTRIRQEVRSPESLLQLAERLVRRLH